MPITSSIQPKKNRIAEIDALRGFALFGILVVNIFVFHAPYAHYGEAYFNSTAWEIFAMENMIFFFVGKFMFLFAFLFGYGCWMQYEKYTDHLAFQQFWWRRMWWLALFGLLHILTLSMGDILLPYALLGMTLPFVLRLSNRWLLLLFLLVYLVPVYEFVLRQLVDYTSVFTTSKYSLEEYNELHRSGNLWELFKLRLYDYWSLRNEKLVMYIPKEWSLFVLGILAAKDQLVHRLAWKQGLLFCIMAVMVVGVWYFLRPDAFAFFDFEQSTFQAASLGVLVQGIDFIHGMLYIIGFWLLWRIFPFRKCFFFLKSVGRMSLSNYILQSLFCVFIFSGWGLGYYGRLQPSELLLIALGFFLFQALCSWWWLRHFSFGPLEGLWRRLTYRKK